MNAVTKNKQGDAILRKMLSQAFGDKVDVEQAKFKELEGGFCNVVYLTSFENGEEYIIKIAPHKGITMMSYEKGLLETEVAVLKLIEEEMDVPIPKVIFYDSTETICNAPYFIMSKMEGIPYNEIQEQLIDIEHFEVRRQIGMFNYKMNQIKGVHFGLFSNEATWHRSWKACMLVLFRMMLDDGIVAGSNLKHISYEALWKLINEKAGVLEDVTEPSLVHWDLWDGNVFVKNKVFSGIIDFERALWGDILMEHEFSGFGEPAEGFGEGYGKKTYSRSELQRRSLYRLYRYLSMIIECDYRQYEENWQYDWITGELEKELHRLRAF